MPSYMQIQSPGLVGQIALTSTIAFGPGHESLVTLLGFPLISICWLQLITDPSLSSISPSLCLYCPSQWSRSSQRPRNLNPKSIRGRPPQTALIRAIMATCTWSLKQEGVGNWGGKCELDGGNWWATATAFEGQQWPCRATERRV